MKGCRPLTDAEVAATMKALGCRRSKNRDRALFVLGHRSGFRISELCSLTVGDVFQNGRVVDRVYVARSRMKGKREGRQVPLHPDARRALAAWVRELAARGRGAPDTHLFLSRQGRNRPINRRTAWKFLTEACRLAGVTGKLGTHCMRKTFAKRIHAALGNDLLKTQKALGHRRIDSTVSYLDADGGEIEDAILKS